MRVIRGLLVGLVMMSRVAMAQLAGPAPVAAPLWAAGAPGAQGDAATDVPTLTAYLPASNPTRTAVVIAPGGGYQHLEMEREGSDIARWLNAHGVAGFVLTYRLGPKYHYPVELEDAQRAVRTVRARAAEYGVAADHVGMWGFSAGGHLAGMTGTHFDAGEVAAADAIDRVSSRPDFLVLAYPVITMGIPNTHGGSRHHLLGDSPTPELVELTSDEKQVTAQTPPSFLFATTDDPVVPVENSVMFYDALVKAKVSAEMHLYQHGPHGVGLAPGFPELKGWPDELARWMTANGWMAGAATSKAATP